MRYKILATSAASVLLAACCLAASDNSGISAQDQQFANKAWNINQGEITLGQMAENQASDSHVKSFAKDMVKDHTKLNKELTKMVEKDGGTLPTSLDQMQQQDQQKLQGLSGSDFDKQYMACMIKGHQKAVDLFQKESQDQAQTDIDKWAGKSLPKLQDHLQMAMQTGQAVGAPMPQNGKAITAGSSENQGK